MFRPAVFRTLGFTALAVLCLGFLPLPVPAVQLEVLQEKLHESGAGWQAGETSLSHLSAEEFRGMLGFKVLKRDGITLHLDRTPQREAVYALPPALDWRSNNGNWVTTVKNQGQCGACYAFATLAAFETLIRLDAGSPDLEVDLSEQHLISCGPSGTRDGYSYGGCIGNYSDYVADFLSTVGSPDEACFPYDSGQDTGSEPSCEGTCPDAIFRMKNITRWSYIAPGTNYYLPQPEEIKAVLLNKPVPCGMFIFDDFKHYTGGVYEPVPGQEILGGHLACIVGYDDSQNCWIVKNSWGTEWGESGFFRIGYSQTSNDSLTMFGVEALDIEYSSPVTSTTTTAVTTTTTIQDTELPNLIPCAPYGWSSPIVPSAERGTSNFDEQKDLLYPTPRRTYIDFAVCNDSEVRLTRPFAVSLFIDGTEAYTAEMSEQLEGKSYRVWLDEQFTFSEGQHTLMVAVDTRDEIGEEDEGDNTVEMSFSWNSLWPQLYEGMFNSGNGDTVRLLRRLRDEVLMAGSEGRASVSMLYRLSSEIAVLLLHDQELRRQTAEVIRQLLPEAACLADGETVMLTFAKRASCEALLDRFAERGGPKVKALAAVLHEKMREGTLFGELGIQVE